MSFDFHRAELLAADDRMRRLAEGLNDLWTLAKALDADQALIMGIATLTGRAEGACMPSTTRARYEAEQEREPSQNSYDAFLNTIADSSGMPRHLLRGEPR